MTHFAADTFTELLQKLTLSYCVTSTSLDSGEEFGISAETIFTPFTNTEYEGFMALLAAASSLEQEAKAVEISTEAAIILFSFIFFLNLKLYYSPILRSSNWSR